MRNGTVAGSLLVMTLMAVRADAQIVGAPVDLPVGLRETNASLPSLAGAALEGPGSEIGATVRAIRADEVATVIPGSLAVLVERVTEDGPAARAGLKVGDVIYFFTRRTDIDAITQFARLVHDTPPGRVLPVGVFRNDVQTRIALLPELGRAASASQP
jgi:hypothetical protein